LKKYPPLNPPPPKLKRKKSLSPFWPDLYPSQVQFFFIEFDWPRQKKIETMKAHKNWRFCGQMECLPLWLTDICEKGRTLSKTYGINLCFWRLFCFVLWSCMTWVTLVLGVQGWSVSRL
jgi:hypothetical protein